MRGGVSLAAALAIPLTTDAGEPFPGRSLILFLTFAVIFGTLVVQGLTLPAVIRLLRLEDDGEAEGRELAQARIRAAEAALARLEELTGEDWVREDTAERVRGGYGFRQNRFAAWLDGERRRLRSRRARTTSSGCAASCSPPSARPSTSCAARARSPTRWRGGSSATSTSRTRGSRSSACSSASAARNASNDGFRLPSAAMNPDCQRAGSPSSRSRNQSSMSIRGCALAIANDSPTYRACVAQETPKIPSGGFVW